ncbi:MAG: YcjF family protein [Cetobacterium sp.]|uniref:YcjF family protein n=1 Tax=Cetobacterium sp. TaxID=2071632 RepID=UPI003F34D157
MDENKEVKCHGIIHTASAATGGVGAGLAQLPLADAIPIMALQVGMVMSLASVYEVELTEGAAKGLVAGFAGTTAGRNVAGVLVGWVPGIGNAIKASTAVALTEMIGWAAVKHFENIINEKNDEREKGYKTGVKEGEKLSHEKFNKILNEVIMRDNFLMATVALGVVVAKCNKDSYIDRISELEKIIGDVVNNPTININLKKQIVNIKKSIYRFEDIEKYLSKVDNQGLKYLNSLVNSLVNSLISIKKSEIISEISFQNIWKKYLESRGVTYNE